MAAVSNRQLVVAHFRWRSSQVNWTTDKRWRPVSLSYCSLWSSVLNQGQPISKLTGCSRLSLATEQQIKSKERVDLVLRVWERYVWWRLRQVAERTAWVVRPSVRRSRAQPAGVRRSSLSTPTQPTSTPPVSVRHVVFHFTSSYDVSCCFVTLLCDVLLTEWRKNRTSVTIIRTSDYVTWFTAGGAIRIAHYDVIDDVITRKL